MEKILSEAELDAVEQWQLDHPEEAEADDPVVRWALRGGIGGGGLQTGSPHLTKYIV